MVKIILYLPNESYDPLDFNPHVSTSYFLHSQNVCLLDVQHLCPNNDEHQFEVSSAH